tara:strand:- start:351 stop:1340 length:990 start_codon:yes stop_codon:yes gene_type:complete
MAGILNNKTRIMDTIFTDEGQRQLGNGKVRIRYVSFTDEDTFYEADAASGSSDASNRLFFEASSLPKDRIVMERNNALNLMGPSSLTGSVKLINGTLLVRSGNTGDLIPDFKVPGTQVFLTSSNAVCECFSENFTNLRMIGTANTYTEFNNKFDINYSFDGVASTARGAVKFKISQTAPLPNGGIRSARISSAENFIQDFRLNQVPSFRVMHPINKDGSRLITANIPSQPDVDSFDQLVNKMRANNMPSQTIQFYRNSLTSNILSEIYQIDSDTNTIQKLDIVDFGEFYVEEPLPNEGGNRKRVFFVGKILKDENNVNKFINIFTVVFE